MRGTQMNLATQKARQALKDNLKYIDAQKDPVRWNFNAALSNLADSIAAIQDQQSVIASQLQAIERLLRR